ncbi:MAG: murein biosynthesis integral membrane protein MurJ, partial [Anaeromyxobacteraceae bacterium]
VLALVAWGTAKGLALVLPARGLPRQLGLALLPIAVGGVAYLAAAKALRIPELDELVGVLRRRRARG